MRDQGDVEEIISVDAHIDDELRQNFRDEQVEHAQGFSEGSFNMSLLVNFVCHVVVLED